MNYELSIVILHGWGLRGRIYHELAALLKKKGFRVFAPDLPGFAAEPLKNSSMNLDGYVDFVRDFIGKNKIKKPILIGHSFGGRIAIKYAFKHPKNVSKLILTGVPIIRDDSFFRKMAYVAAVIGGKVFKFAPGKSKNFLRKVLYFLIGEWDYYKAGPLSEVFKNIISEDLKIYLGRIKIPVVFIWGREDKITPLSAKEKIKKILPFSRFIVIDNAGHKLPYEKPEIFKDAVLKFLSYD